MPGQWLDVHLPNLRQAGGFTITSTPSEARPSSHSHPFLELAVQKSSNPPAKWLWQPAEDILGSQVAVRVGGSFTWPPPELDVQPIERLVLIAGGVGIKSVSMRYIPKLCCRFADTQDSPLISIFSHLVRLPTARRPPEIHFVYTTRTDPDLDPQKILFLPRLMDLVAAAADSNVTLTCFLTGLGDEGIIEHGKYPNRTYGRRITGTDLLRAIDGERPNMFGVEHDRKRILSYVCGPPAMTDEFVAFLRKQTGMSEDRVLCEKWW